MPFNRGTKSNIRSTSSLVSLNTKNDLKRVQSTERVTADVHELPEMRSTSKEHVLSSKQLKFVLILVVVAIFILAAVSMSVASLVLNISLTNRMSSNNSSGSQSSSSTIYTYTQTFAQNTIPAAQCIAWRSFLAQLDPTRSYNSITLSGTFASRDMHLNVGTIVTAIVQLLHFGVNYNGIAVGNLTWFVNFCGLGIEANPPNPWGCGCGGYISRNALYPCVSTGDWGGLNGSLCGSSTQTITLTIQ